MREELIELWAQLFERELRAELETEAPREDASVAVRSVEPS